jgi:two-component system, OmpR family, response regulator ChvI
MQPTGASVVFIMPTVNADTPDTIAIVDDDPLMRRTMAANLEDAGFRAMPFDGGQAALDYFSSGGAAAAMLLDWQMPDVDGPEVLRQLRNNGHQVPVLFLTGHNQPIYEEAALAGGAVDFVDKSKSFSIILQRLKLALAGAKGGGSAGAPPVSEASGIAFDNDSARAFWLGRQVDLTLTEFKVVKLLVAKAGRDVSYREIYDLVRGEGFQAGAGEEGYRANVRAIVKRIRQKFRDVDDNFETIENYPGFGYRWSDGGRT